MTPEAGVLVLGRGQTCHTDDFPTKLRLMHILMKNSMEAENLQTDQK